MTNNGAQQNKRTNNNNKTGCKKAKLTVGFVLKTKMRIFVGMYMKIFVSEVGEDICHKRGEYLWECKKIFVSEVGEQTGE